MSSPAGYEDDHPTEYRPATYDEIAKYQAGVECLDVRELPLEPVESLSASPTSITLAPEDPVLPPPAPVFAAQSPADVPVPPPPPPAPVVPEAPVIPQPPLPPAQ